MENSIKIPELEKIVASINPLIETEVHVIIGVVSEDIRDFVARVYGHIESSAYMKGVELPFSEEELLRYYLTALHVRVAHTTSLEQRRLMRDSGIRVNSLWALPISMAYAVNSIGAAEWGPGKTQFLPVWDSESDSYLLDSAEHSRMTRYLRALKAAGVKLAENIERSRDGVAQVMVLTFAEQAETGSRVVAGPDVFGMNTAMVPLVTGFKATTQNVLGVMPQFVPAYVMDRRQIVKFVEIFAVQSVENP